MFKEINTIGLLGVALIVLKILGYLDSWAAATAPFWGPIVLSLVWRAVRSLTKLRKK